MSDAITFYFNDIFPTYEDFDNFCTEIIGEESDKFFRRYFFNILSRFFSHQNIRYDIPSAFLCEFGNVLQNKYFKYKQQKELIEAMYKLTLDELQQVNTILNNFANNPNYKPDDPLKPLEYISQQSYNVTMSGKLKAYIEAIDNIPTLNIDEIIRGNPRDKNEIQFMDLFMCVQIDERYANRR